MVLVGHGSVHVALEEGEHGEPDARPPTVLVGTGVGQGVIVEEEASGDVEGDEHVDGVVLVSRQDEENPKQVEHPGDGVNQISGPWGVCEGRGMNKGVCDVQCLLQRPVYL